MGGLLSAPSPPNSSSYPAAAASPAMSPSNSGQPHQSKPTQQPKSQESQTPVGETSDRSADAKTTGLQENQEEFKSQNRGALSEEDLEESLRDGEGDEGEEEEGECGFCLFMKGGGCKDVFIEWEKCVEEGEKNKEDIVEKCFQATAALKKCMEAHSDYYAPLLQAEKAAEEEAAKQLEDEKERSNNRGGGGGGGGETLDGSGKKD